MTPRPLRRGLALLAASVLLLTGCTSTSARTAGTSDGAGVVGLALPSDGDLAVVRFGDAVADEMRGRGFRVDLQYAADDDRTQASQVQNMLTKGEDAVVLAPLSASAREAAVDAAAVGGVPIIEVLRAAGEAAVLAAPDPAAVGRAQAEALQSDLPAEPVRLALLAGAAGDTEIATRHSAALAELAPALASGAVTIVSGATIDDAVVAEGPSGVEAGAEARLRALRNGDPAAAPTAVIALADATTRGVVTALTAPAPEESPSPSPTGDADTEPAVDAAPPLVVGSGADAPTARAVRDGVVAATAFVDTRLLAGAVADAVEAAVTGTTAPPEPTVEVVIVRQSAVQPLLRDSGWLDAEDL